MFVSSRSFPMWVQVSLLNGLFSPFRDLSHWFRPLSLLLSSIDDCNSSVSVPYPTPQLLYFEVPRWESPSPPICRTCKWDFTYSLFILLGFKFSTSVFNKVCVKEEMSVQYSFGKIFWEVIPLSSGPDLWDPFITLRKWRTQKTDGVLLNNKHILL